MVLLFFVCLFFFCFFFVFFVFFLLFLFCFLFSCFKCTVSKGGYIFYRVCPVILKTYVHSAVIKSNTVCGEQRLQL